MKDLCQYGNRPEDEWEILPWIPDPRPPFKIWVKPEQIAPFFLIPHHPYALSLLLKINNGFRTEVFRRLGLTGSSGDWERLVRGVIREFEENNSGVDLFHFDSDEAIYNNIVLGKEITDEELQHILVQAGLHEFINTLPNKLETVVGENGIKLSGGEKQRISIARALLKKNPILIFDEATSMLDNETEEKIISILLDSFKDTTIILIAHRLSTVKNANTIYVLNNGTIMEHGNHDQLLEQKGIYYHLYNI